MKTTHSLNALSAVHDCLTGLIRRVGLQILLAEELIIDSWFCIFYIVENLHRNCEWEQKHYSECQGKVINFSVL